MQDYFQPPHGGRPPSAKAIKEATERYKLQEAQGELKNLPRKVTTHK